MYPDKRTYILVDPRDNKIKYVGQTMYPDSRLANHLSPSNKNIDMRNWVNELKKVGKKPKLVTITRHKNDIECDMIERHLIREFSKSNKLINKLNYKIW